MVPLPHIVKSSARWLLAVTMVGVGIAHFATHDDFVAIMPAFLPLHHELVWISGGLEVLGGLGLILPWSRRFAGWGLIALYVCVFPANLNMAINQIGMGGAEPVVWMLWARLPFQAVFIVWAYWVSRPDPLVRSVGEGT